MPGDTIKQYLANRSTLILALSEGPLGTAAAASRAGVKQQTAKRILEKLTDEGLATSWWVPGRTGPLNGQPRDRPEGAFDTLDDAILDALRRGGAGTAADLGPRLGVDPGTVRIAGKRMAEAGTITTWWAGKTTAVIYGLHDQRPKGAVTNAREAVLVAVSREPMDMSELAQATGLGRSTVQRMTEQLRRDGTITRRAGRYTLPNGVTRPRAEEIPPEREIDRLLRLYDSQSEALRKTQADLEARGVYVELAGRAVLRERVEAES